MVHVHVFAIDTLPAPGLVSTGGGLRSQQIIEGLRQQGFEVTYSIPALTKLAKQNWDKLSESERSLSFSWAPGHTYRDIIAQVKPDAVIAMWPMVFTFPRFGREGPKLIYDCNGLQNVENYLASTYAGEVERSHEYTKKYLNKMLVPDALLCGSAEQKAYWQGLLGYHSKKLDPREMITLPFYPPKHPTEIRYVADEPTFICAGSFLPWNSPEGHLIAAARQLARLGKGKLIIVGKPDTSFDHASKVNQELDELRKFDFVRIIEGMPYDELSDLMNGAAIAIDLNSPTMERRIAVAIRSVNYLSHGVPLITNDYTQVGRAIRSAGAGWAINSTDSADLEQAIGSVLNTPVHQLDNMSKASRRIARDMFDPSEGFSQLGEILRSPARRAATTKSGRRSLTISDTRPCVLIITDEFENFLELRLRLPFDAMYQTGLIKGYHVLHCGKLIRSVGSSSDIGNIDTVWVQRWPNENPMFLTDALRGKYVYDIDDNLLVSPSYRPAFSDFWMSTVRTLIRNSSIVTTTSGRLMESLEKHSGEQIEHKTVLAPNLTDDVEVLASAEVPTALLLATSDYLPMTQSRNSFLESLRRFTDKRKVPIVYVGSDTNNFADLGLNIHATGLLDYFSYRELLRQYNFMGVVPLEGHGDGPTQEFVNCKSDIKMVEFGSRGIPAVYSDVAPYRDTPLNIGPLVDFLDVNATVDALDHTFCDHERIRNNGASQVNKHRIARNVVQGTWFRAIQEGRLTSPISLETLVRQEKRYRSFRAEKPADPDLFDAYQYLRYNPDLMDLFFASKSLHPKSNAEITPASRAVIYDHYRLAAADSRRNWLPFAVVDKQALMISTAEQVQREIRELDSLEIQVAKKIDFPSSSEYKPSLAGASSSASHASNNITHTAYTMPSQKFGKRQLDLLRGIKDLRPTKKPPEIFDADFYMQAYQDVRENGIDPYVHWVKHGCNERRNPNAMFDTQWYVRRHPGAGAPGVDPLQHYLKVGAPADCDPSRKFSTAEYRISHPEIGHQNPLEHYLKRK